MRASEKTAPPPPLWQGRQAEERARRRRTQRLDALVETLLSSLLPASLKSARAKGGVRVRVSLETTALPSPPARPTRKTRPAPVPAPSGSPRERERRSRRTCRDLEDGAKLVGRRRKRVDVERALLRSARLLAEQVDEPHLLGRRELLLAEEDDAALRDEDGEVADRLPVVEQGPERDGRRELGADGGREVVLRQLGQRVRRLERARVGRRGDGHGGKGGTGGVQKEGVWVAVGRRERRDASGRREEGQG